MVYPSEDEAFREDSVSTPASPTGMSEGQEPELSPADDIVVMSPAGVLALAVRTEAVNLRTARSDGVGFWWPGNRSGRAYK